MCCKKFMNHTRKPEGLGGRIMVNLMNKGHSPISKWGMSFIPEDKNFKSILDIGCGGGYNINQLLNKYNDSKVTGVDYSDVSVKKTSKYNKEFIDESRLEVYSANVEDLPFENNTFDLITAFETVYFWPGPTESFKEVFRVLQDDGYFLLINEVSGKDEERAAKWTSIIEGMVVYSPEQLKTHLEEAGFKDIKIEEEDDKICVISKK